MDTKINRNSTIRFGLLALALWAAPLAATSGCVALEAEDLEAIEPGEEQQQGTIAQALEYLPCPSNLSHRRGNNEEKVFCYCDSAATSSGNVWGTDLYTDNSALCRAAVHAGAITTAGGPIKATIKPGSPKYFRWTRHGVTSYSSGFSLGSYVVDAADCCEPNVKRRYVPMAFYASMQGPMTSTSNDTEWRTSFAIHNPSPVSQSIVVTAYDYAGQTYWRPPVTLPAGGAASFQLNGGNIPEGFEGAVLLEGSATFEVTTVQVPVQSSVLNRPVVNATARPTNALHFPTVMRNVESRSTKLNLWNTRASVDTLQLKFHDQNGDLRCASNLAFDPSAVRALDLRDASFPGCGQLPNWWEGALTIETASPNGQIAGSAMLVDTAGPRVSAYEGIPVGGVPFFPSVLRSFGAPAHSSSLAFQNYNGGRNTFSVRFAERDSLQEWFVPWGVMGQGRQDLETRDLPELPSGFIGSASLLYPHEAIAALSTVTRDDGGANAEAVSPAIYASDGAGTRLSLPYVRWTAASSDAQPRTSIAVQNLDDVAVTVRVRYMNANGDQVCGPAVCEHELPIGPHQKKNSTPGDIGVPEFGYSPTFGGSAIVERVDGGGSLGLGVVVRMYGPTMAEDYTGIPIPF